jgi:hypothetical protein
MNKLLREKATKAAEQASETTVPQCRKKRGDDESVADPTLPVHTKAPALSPSGTPPDVVATQGNSERFDKLLAEQP